MWYKHVMKTLVFLIGLTCTIIDCTAFAQEPYRLNPGDVLSISVWNEEALNQDVMILPDGTISFPLVGILTVSNQTPEQVRDKLKEQLSRLIPDPEINLTVRTVDGNNIFIIGKVNQPGRFTMNSPTDVVQALSLAGGFTPYAKSDSIQILRRTGEKQEIIRFDYTKIADGEALETNILLKSGDTIVVP
jgi:polysaccharide export outer membrane protein